MSKIIVKRELVRQLVNEEVRREVEAGVLGAGIAVASHSLTYTAGGVGAVLNKLSSKMGRDFDWLATKVAPVLRTRAKVYGFFNSEHERLMNGAAAAMQYANQIEQLAATINVKAYNTKNQAAADQVRSSIPQLQAEAQKMKQLAGLLQEAAKEVGQAAQGEG